MKERLDSMWLGCTTGAVEMYRALNGFRMKERLDSMWLGCTTGAVEMYKCKELAKLWMTSPCSRGGFVLKSY